MKKRFTPVMLIILGLLFFANNNTYAQNNSDYAQRIKFQLNKFFDITGDCQKGSDESLKVRKRLKLLEGNGECNGFVDQDGNGECDNCGGTGECDRTRDQDGKLKKHKGGN